MHINALVFLCLWTACASTLLGPASYAAAPALPEGLAAAGPAALAKFTASFTTPEGKRAAGLPPEIDASRLSLGEPFAPSFLAMADPQKIQTAGSLAQLLTAGDEWYYPVQAEGKVLCFMTVTRLAANSWVEDRFGMADLARAWSAINTAWPREKGYKPIFVIVPENMQLFFAVPEAPEPNLTRFDISAGSESPERYRSLAPLKQTLSTISRNSPSK